MLPRARTGEGVLREPFTRSSSWADHCALSRKGRGHERGEPRILAKRTQRILLESSPRKRGPMITAGGYGSRLSPRFREGRPGRQPVQSWQNQPAAVQNQRRLSFIVCGLLFTMTFATRTCRPHWARKIFQGNICVDMVVEPRSHSNGSSIHRARCVAVSWRGRVLVRTHGFL